MQKKVIHVLNVYAEKSEKFGVHLYLAALSQIL